MAVLKFVGAVTVDKALDTSSALMEPAYAVAPGFISGFEYGAAAGLSTNPFVKSSSAKRRSSAVDCQSDPAGGGGGGGGEEEVPRGVSANHVIGGVSVYPSRQLAHPEDILFAALSVDAAAGLNNVDGGGVIANFSLTSSN
jgi:hypothetical protein